MICKKLERYTFALRKLRQSLSKEAALTAYHGYVSSQFDYGLLLWGNCVDIEKVLIFQKRCIRAINNAGFLDSCKPLFKKCNILPLPCMYIKQVCLFVKSHPQYYKTRGECKGRVTRQKYMQLLYKPFCYKMVYKKNVYNMSVDIYNKLPSNIKILNGTSFTNALTKWLLAQ